MSLVKLECPICFHEDNSFKLLDCGHHFCSKCVDQLRMAKATPSAPPSSVPSTLTENEDIADPVSVPSPTMRANFKDMECPQCRHITPSTSLLKPKFMGSLPCRQCDEEKLAEEFRWCTQCVVAVCSRCFVDKHMNMNEEGVMCLHSGCKWDADFPAAKHCIGQLKREVQGLNEHIKKTQDYIRSYLEGFQEYLCREIEQKIRSSEQGYETKIAAISEAYGVDEKLIHPADQANRNYESVLSDLLKVAKIKITSPEEFTETQVKIKCLPYKEMAQVLLGGTSCNSNQQSNHLSVNQRPVPDGKPTSTNAQQPQTMKVPDVDMGNHLAAATANVYPTVPPNEIFDATKSNNLLNTDFVNRKLNSTTAIGTNVIRQPSDIAYLPNEEILLISDFVGGIYTLSKQTILMGPMPSKGHYGHYSRLTRVPEAILGPAVLVSVQVGAVWHYMIVSVRNDGYTEQIKLRGRDQYHCNFPTPRNPTLSSSDRSLFCLTAKTLYRFSWPCVDDWTDVYTVSTTKQPANQQGRLGPILDRQDSTVIFLTNGAWRAVDVLTLSYPENKMWNVRRIKFESLLPPGIAQSLTDPYLAKLQDQGDLLLLSDKKQTTMYAWNVNNESCIEWHRYPTKVPQKIIVCNNWLFILSQQKDNAFLRSVEIVRL